jgi:hypothetical protein
MKKLLSMTDRNSFDFDSMGRAVYLWADLEEKTYPTKSKYQLRVFFPPPWKWPHRKVQVSI